MRLELASVAFNQPWLVREQIRLLRANLTDDYGLVVVDASDRPGESKLIEEEARAGGVGYLRSTSHAHHEALNYAAAHLLDTGADAIGLLDHDIFPAKPTSIVAMLDCGFFGVGQRHAPTGRFYLWPGFCFFTRGWLAGRKLDFDGIRGAVKADDGDTGSANWPLFEHVDWSDMYRAPHGYRALRPPDDFGLQSWGYETIGDWIHMSNGSRWMAIPEPMERERLFREVLDAL